MKLGILIETEEGLDWDTWLTTLSAAERLGFDSVWISDHLASPWAAGRHGLEPWVALSVAAVKTQRLRLGTLVSPITFRQPALLARMAESIDDLAGGRFVLGLGLGWNADEHRRFGIPFPALQDRVRGLIAGLDCVREVLGERRVPILIGGMGTRSTLPIVASYADEWNLTTSSVEVYRERSRALAERCRSIGRDPATIRRSVAVGFLVGREAADLEERCARMQRLVPPLAAAETDNVVSGGQAVIDNVVRTARGLGWLAGTPAQLCAALQPLAAAGVDLAILGHYDPTDVAALELIAHEVMPAVA